MTGLDKKLAERLLRAGSWIVFSIAEAFGMLEVMLPNMFIDCWIKMCDR